MARFFNEPHYSNRMVHREVQARRANNSVRARAVRCVPGEVNSRLSGLRPTGGLADHTANNRFAMYLRSLLTPLFFGLDNSQGRLEQIVRDFELGMLGPISFAMLRNQSI
jgi:hypothetical protein